MAEVVEYTLVVLTALVFAGASVAVYGQYAQVQAAFVSKASFSELTNLAQDAVLNGSSTSSFVIPQSTLTCSGGALSLSTSSGNQSAATGVSCDFHFNIQAGLHTFVFTYNSTVLTLGVD